MGLHCYRLSLVVANGASLSCNALATIAGASHCWEHGLQALGLQ